MIKVGDIVNTIDIMIDPEYRTPIEGSLVIACKPRTKACLLFVPTTCLCDQNIEFFEKESNGNERIDWIDDLKVINPDNKLLWYSVNALIKFITVNLPDGTQQYVAAKPILDSIIVIENKKYRIDEISVDESAAWVEEVL